MKNNPLTPLEHLEMLDLILEEINLSGLPVIIEGKNDEKCLRELGIKNTLIRLKAPGTIQEIIEGIPKEFHELIILTDWDRTGCRLADMAIRILEHEGFKANTEIRKKVMMLAKPYISQVEELDKLHELFKKRINEG